MVQCIAYNDDSIRDSSNDNQPMKDDEIIVRYRADVSELEKQLNEAIQLLEKFKAKCDSLGIKINVDHEPKKDEGFVTMTESPGAG